MAVKVWLGLLLLLRRWCSAVGLDVMQDIVVHDADQMTADCTFQPGVYILTELGELALRVLQSPLQRPHLIIFFSNALMSKNYI